MRVILITLACAYLVGCSHLIERHITTNTGISSIQGMEFFARDSTVHCEQANASRCVEIIDWVQQSDPPDVLKLEFSLRVDGEVFPSEEVFNIEPLAADAPLILLFPGYGMPSRGLGFMAEYFRAQGFYPLVVSSPTEQRPFTFGVHNAQIVAAIIGEQYRDRRVYAYGFSMGSLAVAEFHQVYPLEGAIVVAPMLDFHGSAEYLMRRYRDNSFWARTIPVRSYEKGLQRMLSTSEVELDKLDWPYAVANLPENTLIIGSEADSMSRFSVLANEVEVQQRPFKMAGLEESHMLHPFMVLPVESITQPLSKWLSAQSQ